MLAVICYFLIGKGWPLNYHLVFDLLAVGAVGAFLLCLWLPASIERKRESLSATESTLNTSTSEDVSEHHSSIDCDSVSDHGDDGY